MSRASRLTEAAHKLHVRRPKPRVVLDAEAVERMNAAASLAHERQTVQLLDELTEGLPRTSAGVILGPDGRPLLRPVTRDYTDTHGDGTDVVRLHAEDILKRAARMQRDGMSAQAILVELDIAHIVPPGDVFDRAMKLGHELLARDIRAGIEPEESKIVVGYEAVNEDGSKIEDDPADDTGNTTMSARPIRTFRQVEDDDGEP